MVSPHPGTLDVILRTHDPARLDELGRALFSALLQDHRPTTLTIVCQRFPEPALAALETLLSPLRTIEPGVPIQDLHQFGLENFDL